MQIEEILKPSDQPIESKVICKSEAFKATHITLAKGKVIKEHITPITAFLVVREGHITFNYQKEAIRLEAGDYMTIQPNEPHWVVAEKDSKFILVK